MLSFLQQIQITICAIDNSKFLEFVQLKKRETDPCRGILLEALRETQDILFGKFV